MQVKLAEALLRRKELQIKLNTIKPFATANIFEQKVQRVKVSDGIDEVVANVPKLTLSQVTHEIDYYSKQLRLVDAAIQQANWTSTIETDGDVMKDYGDAYGLAVKV